MENTQRIVRVELSTTINLGNFENFKISIDVSDYVRDTDLNTSTAIDRVYKLVEDKLAEKASIYSDKR